MKINIKKIDVVFGMIFSFLLLISSKICYSGNLYGKINENFIKDFNFCDILVFIGIFLVFIIVVKLFEDKKLLNKTRSFFKTIFISENNVKHKKLFNIIVFLILFCMWMAYFLSFYPGTVLADSVSSIYQALGHIKYSNHFPIVYTLYIKLLLKIGMTLFNDINIGIALYSLSQMIIMAFTLTNVISLLERLKIRLWVIILVILFYGLSPVFGTYAIVLWKDPIYSCAITLITVMLIKHVLLKEDIFGNLKRSIYFIILLLTVVFFRSNGIYVVIGLFVFMLLSNRKNWKKLLIIFIVPIISYFVLIVILSKKNIKNEFVESIGVPLQQIAYTVSKDGKFSKKDQEFLYKILPKDYWVKKYIPCLVDPIKWDENFNSSFLEKNKKEFIMVWIRGLSNNFNYYVKAYILDTFGYYKPFVQDTYGYTAIGVSNNYVGIYSTDIVNKVTGISISTILNKNLIMIGSGTITFIMIISCYLMCKYSKKSYLIFIPCFINYLTIMIASPVAFSLRYVYCQVLLLPVFILTPFLKSNFLSKKGVC